MNESKFQGGQGLSPDGLVRQGLHATPGPLEGLENEWYNQPQYAAYTKVPTDYSVQISLGGAAGARVQGTIQLRPEPFLCNIITYATTGDTLTQAQLAGGNTLPQHAYSQQARSVELTWGDEFTRFMGSQAALVAAIFADSEGFLDLPAPILFQGSQTLTVELHRLFWPYFVAEVIEIPEVETSWDFIFKGVSLLPLGVNESGSEGG